MSSFIELRGSDVSIPQTVKWFPVLPASRNSPEADGRWNSPPVAQVSFEICIQLSGRSRSLQVTAAVISLYDVSSWKRSIDQLRREGGREGGGSGLPLLLLQPASV